MGSMLFSDISLNFDGVNLISYGNRSDICYLEKREVMKGKPASEEVAVNKALEGKLEGVPVVKFKINGNIVCLSFATMNKILEAHPEALKAALEKEKEFEDAKK